MADHPIIRILTPAVLVLAGALMAQPAGAAGYIKIGDIKGESLDARSGNSAHRSGGHKDEIDILSWSWGEYRTSSGGGEQVMRPTYGSGTRQTDVENMQFKQQYGQTQGQRTRGDTTMGDVSVVKELDKSSPKLQESATSGSAASGDVVVVKELDKSSPKLQEASAGGDAGSGMSTGRRQHGSFSSGSQQPPANNSGPGSLTITTRVDKSSPMLARYCGQGGRIPEMEVAGPQTNKKAPTYMTYKLTNVMVTSCADGDDRPTEEITFNYEKIKWTYNKQGQGDASSPAPSRSGNVEYDWKVEKGEK